MTGTPGDQTGRAVVIAAGGTGGHLFPAQALAQELARRGYALHLVTDERGRTYTSAFPDAQIHMVNAATFAGLGPVGRVAAMGKIGVGLAGAVGLMGRLKPAAVIGFGGYPSLPAMGAAILRRLPTCLHEQNAVLGRVNRALSRRVDVIAGAFDTMRGLDDKTRARFVATGNPVRDAIRAAAGSPYEVSEEGQPFRLLIFGGSQGAHVFSTLVPEALAGLDAALRGRLRIVQQCRPEDLNEVRTAYETAGIEAELAPFFDDMDTKLKQAHLVISRAGASTVTELAVVGRPAILVPLPSAMDDHQTANAEALTKAGGGWLMQQGDLSADHLAARLTELMNDPARLAQAAGAALTAGRPDATAELADLVDRLAEQGRAGALLPRAQEAAQG
ncbi:MAG: undecaprenyldiphospho-muramoylpentapeptide beta-N-acetylglucosaminyltransferase [Alphaproteobacteria bacterium]